MHRLVRSQPVERSASQQLQRVFDQRFQSLHEIGCVPAVDDPVVAGKRQVHAPPDFEIAIDHDRLFLDLVDRDDRDFRAVDHRRRGHAANRAVVLFPMEASRPRRLNTPMAMPVERPKSLVEKISPARRVQIASAWETDKWR